MVWKLLLSETAARDLRHLHLGCTEDVVVCSCLGDAVDGTRLRLAWVVSARPCFPRSVGAKRDRRSTYWLWTGAAVAEAGEARERWKTAKRPELQKRKGEEKEKEASELSNSPSSAESESCGGGQPSNRTYRKGGEERRRKKRLNCQILPAAPRASAASSLLPLFSSRVLRPAPHFWQPPPLPSSPSIQEPADRLFPAEPTSVAPGMTAKVFHGLVEHRGP
ncbi:uncharacterized protein LOC142093165 [Calonectris borealis]|uniref:uncharacterized protein LOC142093165 n=1 Tax=Calonectris borealis TaxID=1323832 RepID=UPI003F4C6E40